MGLLLYSGFCAILPPNSPNCNPNSNDASGYSLMSATSYHPGGVHAGLGDGSVRFISDTVDTGTLTKTSVSSGTGSNNGESNFGVWGALGTVAAGESKAL